MNNNRLRAISILVLTRGLWCSLLFILQFQKKIDDVEISWALGATLDLFYKLDRYREIRGGSEPSAVLVN